MMAIDKRQPLASVGHAHNFFILFYYGRGLLNCVPNLKTQTWGDLFWQIEINQNGKPLIFGETIFTTAFAEILLSIQ